MNAIIGDVFYTEREWASAIEHLERCVDKKDLVVLDEIDLLDKLSYALQKDSPRYSLEDTIIICKKLLDLEPTANIYFRLGHAQYMLNRFDEAIETFKRSLELDPAHISTANDLAKAYAFSGRRDELRLFIENPPVALRKYTLEIAERALSQHVNTKDVINGLRLNEAPESYSGIRRRYWAYALPIIKETHGPKGPFRNVTTSKEDWINGAIGINGFYITCEVRIKKASVCLSLINYEKDKNKSAFDYLASNKTEIEEQLGVSLKWWRLDDRKASYICFYKGDVSIRDETSWAQMADFHAEWSRKFFDVFVPILNTWKTIN